MPDKNIKKFFISIVVPSILAMTLFIISFYIIVIPLFEKSMMDRKKEMILELTNTAWSVMEEYHNNYKTGEMSLETAKKAAAAQIEQMRYGPEQKDYFWIINYNPDMIMHPYRKDLNNTDLSDYKDSHENKLFVDAAELVKEKGSGFIEYYWQWKDDTTRIVPKLSYVKGFKEWEWIVGTGIYLEDVRKEISYLKRRLFYIATGIIVIILITLAYVIRQSLNIENKRKKAEQNLWLSRQKYKSLVDASTEGTLMFVNNKVIFANMKFVEMFDCQSSDVYKLAFDEIFETKWDEVDQKFTDPNKSVTLETKMLCQGKAIKEIVISISKMKYTDREGIIVITKDISEQKQMEKGAQKLSQELETSFHMMNQPIKVFIKEPVTCLLGDSIEEAATKMTQKNQKAILIKENNQIIGIVNDADLKKRVIAQSLSFTDPVSKIMSSPVVNIHSDALLYEAILSFKKNRVSHLLVTDGSGKTAGIISNQDCLEMQRNSLSYLIQEIESSHLVNELKKIYNRLPVMINSLLTSGDNIHNINRIITSVADAITTRVIDLAIEDMGTPPCKFAFIAMGSEGRSEQTLKTDQDNAIVFEDNQENVQTWFINLAKAINQNLNIIGYKKCPGEIMAGNSKYCQPVGTWKKYFTDWTHSPDPKNVMDSSIFFDFRFIYGNEKFVHELRDHVNLETDHNGLFFYHMSNNIAQYKPSFEHQSIDLKKIILPITGYIRLYALYHKLSISNSMNRLETLYENEHIDKTRKEEIEKMFSFTMQLRIKNQVKKILNNELPENIIETKDISKLEESTIKKILSEIGELQSELSMEFKGGDYMA